MVDDLIKSIKAQLYERVSSPLISSFILSWSIWNFRLLCVIFSKTPSSDKLLLIDNLIDMDRYYFKTAIGPIITTLLFIFVYPYPAKYVYEFTRKRQKELKEIKQKIEDETPLTLEESRNIRSDYYLLKKEYEKLVDDKDNEIRSIKEHYEQEIAELQSHLDVKNIDYAKSSAKETESNNKYLEDSISESKNQTNKEIDNIKQTILKHIGNSSALRSQDVVKLFGGRLNRIRVEVLLTELIHAGFVIESGNYYKLSEMAKKYLVENNIV